jgi:hypothetical protein
VKLLGCRRDVLQLSECDIPLVVAVAHACHLFLC